MYHFQKSIVDSFDFKPSSGRADRSAIDPLTFKPHDTYPRRKWFSSDFAPVLRVHTHMAQGTAKSGLQTAPDFHGGHPFKAAEQLPEMFRMTEYDFGSGYPKNASISSGTLMMARSRDEYYTGSGEQRNLNSREFERGLAAALEEFDKREAARKSGAAGTVATSSSVSSKKSLDATPEPESSPPSPTSPPSLLSSQTPTSSLLPPTLTVGPIIPTTPTGGDSGVGGGGKTSGKQSPAGKPSSPKKTGGGPTTMKEPPASPGRESGDDYPDLRLRMPKEIQTLYEYIQFLTDKEVEHDIITKLNTELETLGHPPLHGNVKKKESIISILKGLYKPSSDKPSTGEKKTKSKKSV